MASFHMAPNMPATKPGMYQTPSSVHRRKPCIERKPAPVGLSIVLSLQGLRWLCGGQEELHESDSSMCRLKPSLLPLVCNRCGDWTVHPLTRSQGSSALMCCFANTGGLLKGMHLYFPRARTISPLFFPLKDSPWHLISATHTGGAPSPLPTSPSFEPAADTNVVLGPWAFAKTDYILPWSREFYRWKREETLRHLRPRPLAQLYN